MYYIINSVEYSIYRSKDKQKVLNKFNEMVSRARSWNEPITFRMSDVKPSKPKQSIQCNILTYKSVA